MAKTIDKKIKINEREFEEEMLSIMNIVINEKDYNKLNNSYLKQRGFKSRGIELDYYKRGNELFFEVRKGYI